MLRVPRFPFSDDVLDNGVRLMVVEDDDAPVASVQVWHFVGSAHESYGETGVSHLLEHMMFSGTERVPNFAERIGEMGGSPNAWTSRDYTVYFETVPAARVLDVLELEADRAYNLTFEGFEREREVVKEERRWRTENSLEGAMWEAAWFTSFSASPYRHPIEGWMADLEAMTESRVRDYFARWYGGPTIVVSGDVRRDEITGAVERLFRKGAHDAPSEPTVSPEAPGERVVTLDRESRATRALFTYRLPPASDDDVVAAQVMNYALGVGKSSVLYERMVRGARVASEVASDVAAGRYGSLLVVSAVLNAGRGLHELMTELDEALDYLFGHLDEGRLERGRRMMYASGVYETETAGERGFKLGMSTSLGGKPDFLFDVVDRAMAVESVDAPKLLSVNRRSVVVVEGNA